MNNKESSHKKNSMIGIAIRISLVMIVLCGIIYPTVSTGVAQVIFPNQANGSMVKDGEGKVIGSELIGQTFTNPAFFQGRISSIENNGAGSGSNNYAPSNPELVKRIQQSMVAWEAANPDVPLEQLPIDLVTNSGSGLDPHISPASAKAQIPRISKLTGLDQAVLQELVDSHTKERDLGVFGEPRVNVLLLNIDLGGKVNK
ncbi:potassium-transporting ATPase subunit KdpC [Paenibacillus antarcticus]|uniref:Potassium-transporting ATPase KdpC subunit n=1 Tax=Paenibacillus antarcticus TaxID=253703 RepID=A0A168NDH9_9BACL|nr:potassium-transporting ATPase subunit KdpC [Paenibacillus antarcticus]OAB45679.1 potassium-transporting ATPase subunit C [Paenibacillus antarcticus]